MIIFGESLMTICYSKFSVTSLIRTNFHITTPRKTPPENLMLPRREAFGKTLRVDSLGSWASPHLEEVLGVLWDPGTPNWP